MRPILFRSILSLIALLAPVLAFAADAVVVDPNATPFVQYILIPLYGALGLALTAAIGYLTVWLRAKAAAAAAAGKSGALEAILAKVSSVIDATLRTVWVEMRAPLEEAAKDGILSADEKAKLKKEAIDRLLAALGASAKAELMGALGVGETGLSTVLSGMVEERLPFVAVAKAAGDLTLARVSADAAKAAEVEAGAVNGAAALEAARSVK